MHWFHSVIRFSLLLSSMLLLLSSCGRNGIAPASPSIPVATGVPAAPTSNPTLPPPQDLPPVLPAPLYYLADGQIWRMERDGVNTRQITFESSAIAEFDLAALNNALVYAVGEGASRSIVVLDASGRTELFTGPASQPRIKPDGSAVLYRLDQPVPGLIIGEESTPTGVWLSYRSGGRPSLVQADDPLPPSLDPAQEVYAYSPVSWSPVGAQFMLFGSNIALAGLPGGQLLIKNQDTNTELELFTCCEEEVWSVDGSAITVTGGGPGPDMRYGLWRIDPATGSEQDLLESQDDSLLPLVTAARQLADGAVYAFVELAPATDVTFDYPFEPTMQRIAADGTLTQLRSERFRLQEALWATDASGAVVADSNPTLRWLPSDGSPARELAMFGSNLRWGSATVTPDAAACANFATISWQPPANRRVDAAVTDVQRRLLALGYSEVGADDGLFGDQTKAAVMAFQQANGLPASGDIDCATWQRLISNGT